MAESLTTERIRKKFKNNFDLCNFAINIARNIIMSGAGGSLTDILRTIEERASEST